MDFNLETINDSIEFLEGHLDVMAKAVREKESADNREHGPDLSDAS